MALTHRIEGTVAIIERSIPLPEVCILTGVRAAGVLPCSFRWKQSGGSVQATLSLPVCQAILSRRRKGLVWITIAILLAIGTSVGMVFGQKYVEAMPPSELQQQLRDFGIPALAIAGFLGILISGVLASRMMPGLASRLEVQEITENTVRLAGTHPEFLAVIRHLWRQQVRG